MDLDLVVMEPCDWSRRAGYRQEMRDSRTWSGQASSKVPESSVAARGYEHEPGTAVGKKLVGWSGCNFVRWVGIERRIGPKKLEDSQQMCVGIRSHNCPAV